MNPIRPSAVHPAVPRMLGLALLLSLTLACQRIAPVRTLPEWVRGISVPMVKNKTFEPQIEETATKLIQEEFMNDARVDIVPKNDADLILAVEITAWEGSSNGTAGNFVTDVEELEVTATVKLFEPFDEKKPLADLGKVHVRSNFNVDIRSIDYVQEPDRKNQILRLLAQQIMLKVLTGFPSALRDQFPGVNMPDFKNPESISADDVLKPRP